MKCVGRKMGIEAKKTKNSRVSKNGRVHRAASKSKSGEVFHAKRYLR